MTKLLSWVHVLFLMVNANFAWAAVTDPVRTNKVIGSILGVGGIRGGTPFVSGWACNPTINGPTKLLFYVKKAKDKGGVLVFSAKTHLKSKNKQSAKCQGEKNGFAIPIPSKVLKRYPNRSIYLYGVLGEGDVKIPVMIKGSGAVPVPGIIGKVEKIVKDSRKGAPVLKGWACQSGVNTSVNVSLYAGGTPRKGGTYLMTVHANLHGKDDAVLTKRCGSKGKPHRFKIPLTRSLLKKFSGKRLYVMAISKTLTPNMVLRGSGKYRVPVLRSKSTASLLQKELPSDVNYMDWAGVFSKVFSAFKFVDWFVPSAQAADYIDESISQFFEEFDYTPNYFGWDDDDYSYGDVYGDYVGYDDEDFLGEYTYYDPLEDPYNGIDIPDLSNQYFESDAWGTGSDCYASGECWDDWGDAGSYSSGPSLWDLPSEYVGLDFNISGAESIFSFEGQNSNAYVYTSQAFLSGLAVPIDPITIDSSLGHLQGLDLSNPFEMDVNAPQPYTFSSVQDFASLSEFENAKVELSEIEVKIANDSIEDFSPENFDAAGSPVSGGGYSDPSAKWYFNKLKSLEDNLTALQAKITTEITLSRAGSLHNVFYSDELQELDDQYAKMTRVYQYKLKHPPAGYGASWEQLAFGSELDVKRLNNLKGLSVIADKNIENGKLGEIATEAAIVAVALHPVVKAVVTVVRGTAGAATAIEVLSTRAASEAAKKAVLAGRTLMTAENAAALTAPTLGSAAASLALGAATGAVGGVGVGGGLYLARAATFAAIDYEADSSKTYLHYLTQEVSKEEFLMNAELGAEWGAALGGLGALAGGALGAGTAVGVTATDAAILASPAMQQLAITSAKIGTQVISAYFGGTSYLASREQFIASIGTTDPVEQKKLIVGGIFDLALTGLITKHLTSSLPNKVKKLDVQEAFTSATKKVSDWLSGNGPSPILKPPRPKPADFDSKASQLSDLAANDPYGTLLETAVARVDVIESFKSAGFSEPFMQAIKTLSPAELAKVTKSFESISRIENNTNPALELAKSDLFSALGRNEIAVTEFVARLEQSEAVVGLRLPEFKSFSAVDNPLNNGRLYEGSTNGSKTNILTQSNHSTLEIQTLKNNVIGLEKFGGPKFLREGFIKNPRTGALEYAVEFEKVEGVALQKLLNELNQDLPRSLTITDKHIKSLEAIEKKLNKSGVSLTGPNAAKIILTADGKVRLTDFGIENQVRPNGGLIDLNRINQPFLETVKQAKEMQTYNDYVAKNAENSVPWTGGDPVLNFKPIRNKAGVIVGYQVPGMGTYVHLKGHSGRTLLMEPMVAKNFFPTETIPIAPFLNGLTLPEDFLHSTYSQGSVRDSFAFNQFMADSANFVAFVSKYKVSAQSTVEALGEMRQRYEQTYPAGGATSPNANYGMPNYKSKTGAGKHDSLDFFGTDVLDAQQSTILTQKALNLVEKFSPERRAFARETSSLFDNSPKTKNVPASQIPKYLLRGFEIVPNSTANVISYRSEPFTDLHGQVHPSMKLNDLYRIEVFGKMQPSGRRSIHRIIVNSVESTAMNFNTVFAAIDARIEMARAEPVAGTAQRVHLLHAMYYFFKSYPLVRGTGAVGRSYFTGELNSTLNRNVQLSGDVDIMALMHGEAAFVSLDSTVINVRPIH